MTTDHSVTPDELGPEPRLVVVGTTGLGKTTVGRRIAEVMGVPFVEMDALNWGPNWTERPLEVFREELREAISCPSWVLDGNYSKVQDVYLPGATDIVWLDYPFLINLWQLISRILRRGIKSEDLWNGNVERLSTHLFTRDSLILWFLKSYWRRKKTYPALFGGPDARHLKLVRLTGRGKTGAWLRRLKVAVEQRRKSSYLDRPKALC